MQRVRIRIGLLLIAGLLALSRGPAQAVIGIPDDVPAATLLYPFFKVDPTPRAASRQDSLIVVTNTANVPVFAHLTLWTVDSLHTYDFTIALTPHDVFSCSLLDLLVNPTGLDKPCGTFQAPLGQSTDLLIADPTTGTAILSGYVTVDTVSQPTSLFPGQAGYPFLDGNVLIGHFYLVNLPAGSSTGFNAVSIEAEVPPGVGLGQPAVALSPFQLGFYLTRCIEEQTAGPCLPFGPYGNRERIDGPSGDFAQTLSGDVLTSTLRVFVPYFSAPALNGRSELWLWKDRVAGASGSGISVAVYDEDENAHSSQFHLPHEVNVTATADISTPGAAGGWFRVDLPCSPFGFCAYPTLGALTQVGEVPVQAVAYSLQFADAVGSGEEQARFLRADAAFPAHRQYTDALGGDA